jgi:hypothetical protein
MAAGDDRRRRMGRQHGTDGLGLAVEGVRPKTEQVQRPCGCRTGIETTAAVTPASTSSTVRGRAVFLANSAIRTASSRLVDVTGEEFPL